MSADPRPAKTPRRRSSMRVLLLAAVLSVVLLVTAHAQAALWVFIAALLYAAVEAGLRYWRR